MGSCDECNQTKLPMITRDKRSDKTKITFKCTLCDTDFARKSSLMRHNKCFHEAFHQIEKDIKRKSNFEETHNKRFVSFAICQFCDLSVLRFVSFAICQFCDLSVLRFV